MTDAVEFFAKVEERLDPPPTLSREDMVILALADDRRTPGFCAACEEPVEGPATRWCELCFPIISRFWNLQGEMRWRRGKKAVRYCECGALIEKGKSAHRCASCQRGARLESQRRRAREKTMREAMA